MSPLLEGHRCVAKHMSFHGAESGRLVYIEMQHLLYRRLSTTIVANLQPTCAHALKAGVVERKTPFTSTEPTRASDSTLFDSFGPSAAAVTSCS